MPKTDRSFDVTAYAMVAERVALFYGRFPTGRIITELMEHSLHEVTFRASVYRTAADSAPSATGWASERIGDGEVNSVACLENTETSAVGRALANLGFTASKHRPSYEEMERARRGQTRLSPPKEEARPALPPTERSAPPAASSATAVATASGDRARASDRESEARADAMADVLGLLAAAERSGLEPGRAKALRAELSARQSLTRIREIEGALRDWISDRVTTRIQEHHLADDA